MSHACYRTSHTLLQGSVIPPLLAMGATDGGLAFFVFEDAGEALAGADFRDAGLRSAALGALRCIHEAGVAHLDLSPRHFRKDDSGVIRIIDFSHSKLEATELDRDEDLSTFEKLVGLFKITPFSISHCQRLTSCIKDHLHILQVHPINRGMYAFGLSPWDSTQGKGKIRRKF